MRQILKWAAGVLSALVIAVVTDTGTGIGSHISTGGGTRQLVSLSAKPVVTECGTQLFIPGSLGTSGQLRGSSEWEAVMRQTKGSVASPSVTTVSIHGETSRPVTLTDIHFSVTRRSRRVDRSEDLRRAYNASRLDVGVDFCADSPCSPQNAVTAQSGSRSGRAAQWSTDERERVASPTRSHRTGSLIQTSTTTAKTCRPNRAVQATVSRRAPLPLSGRSDTSPAFEACKKRRRRECISRGRAKGDMHIAADRVLRRALKGARIAGTPCTLPC